MDRRHFLAGLAATLPSATFAAPPSTAFRPVLRNIANIERSAAASARLLNPSLAQITGYVLIDARTGRVIDSYQPNLALPPASVTKAITAVYARDVLGADFKFVTRLMVFGVIENGVLQGDLFLVGGGDPLLDTDELASLAQSLAGAGIRDITGGFYVDNSALPTIAEIDATQPDHVGYNPSISGTNLNFNRIYFEWKQGVNGYKLTLDARGERYRPQVQWMDIRTENRGAPVFKYTDNNGHDRWSVAKSALGNEGGRWLPVRQPADYVGEVFTTLAASMGVRLPSHKHKTAGRGVREIARISSASLDDMLRWMLKYSNNLTAECFGLTASMALGHNPQTLTQSAAAMGHWTRDKLGVSTAGLRNHSGLTDTSRLSASDMSRLLTSPVSRAHLSGILKPLALVDANGTTLNVDGVSAAAKTGTLNFTRGLAGYLDKNGRTYSFAIFSADLDKRNQIPMEQRESPRGARTWLSHAKVQEKTLLRHWATASF